MKPTNHKAWDPVHLRITKLCNRHKNVRILAVNNAIFEQRELKIVPVAGVH